MGVEVTDEAGADEAEAVEVTTTLEVAELVLVLVELLQGFHVVTVQPLLLPDGAEEVTEDVVVETELLGVADPSATRQTLPVTPAFRHAAESLTNSRYSVAETLALITATEKKPVNRLPRYTARCLNIENILNLHVT